MRYVAIILIFITSTGFGLGQTINTYNPQGFYEQPGGMFSVDSLRTIDINFYDPNYHDTLVSYWYTDTNLRIPAAVTFSNGLFYDSVGVRYKGNSTFAWPEQQGIVKLPLNLDFNYYQLGQEIMNLKKLKLANGMFDPTFAKEVTAYDIYRRYLPSPQANLMRVNVQGDYLGLYVNTESVDRTFLKKHFNENDGVLFKCDPIQQFGQPGPSGNSNLDWLGSDTTLYYNHYTLKSDYGWGELVEFINILNNNPLLLDSVLNVDRVLWAFAVNQVIANLDTYNGLFQHNYYLYQTEDGLFQMIPWDVSESFVGALLNFNPNFNELYEYDPYNGYNCLTEPLVVALTSDPNSKYGKIYTAHLRTVLEESLIRDTIETFVSDLQALGAAAAFEDTNKIFNIIQYYTNVQNQIGGSIFPIAGILSTIDLRKPFLEANPEISKIPPEITNVQLAMIDDEEHVVATVSNVDSVELMFTTSPYNSKFKSYQMYDDGSNGDAVAGDGQFTAMLPNALSSTGSLAKFYIRAANSDAYRLSPRRAEYEFYTYFVKAPEQENDFAVYPNPSTTELFISGDLNSSNYAICSIDGKIVLEGTLDTDMKIDVSTLAAELYFLAIDGKVVKIVKQ